MTRAAAWTLFLPAEPGARLLHVGTFDGHAARELGQRGVHVLSCPSGDVPGLGLDPGTIDAVAAPALRLTGAALHALVADLSRVLAPRGVVFVGVPNGCRKPFGPSRSAVARAMRRVGLARVRTLAPIPHERDVRAVVPLDRPEPLRYCLGGFVRRNSLATAVLSTTADRLAAAGLLQRMLPYYWLLFAR